MGTLLKHLTKGSRWEKYKKRKNNKNLALQSH